MYATNGDRNQAAVATAKRLIEQGQMRLQISNDLMRSSDWKIALTELGMRSAWNSHAHCRHLGIEAIKTNGNGRVLAQILDHAIEITGADFGNIQVFDDSEQALRIALSRGLEAEFLDYFALVQTSESACGVAMQQNRRVIVPDVANDSSFNAQSRTIMLRANALACQSTPLVSSSGRLLGMLSTHYRVPRRPPLRSLRFLDLLASRSADLLG